MLRSAADKLIRRKRESLDGVIYSIDDDTNTVNVRIQGDRTRNIVAHYPQNWGKRPQFLRVGQAVRLLHKSGVNGYLEVAGYGRSIPQYMYSYASATYVDTVVDGLKLDTWIDPSNPTVGAGMNITVDTGTFRIGGSVIALEGLDMDDSNVVMDNGAVLMDGDTTTVVPISKPDAPSSGTDQNFQYDLLVVGADGVIDVVEGPLSIAEMDDSGLTMDSTKTMSDSTPVKPAVPADHLLLGSVLLWSDMGDALSVSNLNAVYSPQRYASFRVEVDDVDIRRQYGETGTYITAYIIDQYDHPWSWTTRFTWTVTIVGGGGRVGLTPASATTTSFVHYVNDVSFTFYYYSNMPLATDHTDSPVIQITVSPLGLTTYCNVNNYCGVEGDGYAIIPHS
jgi:hypothetical protein